MTVLTCHTKISNLGGEFYFIRNKKDNSIEHWNVRLEDKTELPAIILFRDPSIADKFRFTADNACDCEVCKFNKAETDYEYASVFKLDNDGNFDQELFKKEEE